MTIEKLKNKRAGGGGHRSKTRMGKSITGVFALTWMKLCRGRFCFVCCEFMFSYFI